jgi:hypothetical protein
MMEADQENNRRREMNWYIDTRMAQDMANERIQPKRERIVLNERRLASRRRYPTVEQPKEPLRLPHLLHTVARTVSSWLL